MGLPIPGLADALKPLTAKDGVLAGLGEAMNNLASGMVTMTRSNADLARASLALADSNYQLATAINESTSAAKRR